MLSPAAKGNLYLHKEGGVVIHVAFTFSTTLLVNLPFLRLPAALREQQPFSAVIFCGLSTVIIKTAVKWTVFSVIFLVCCTSFSDTQYNVPFVSFTLKKRAFCVMKTSKTNTSPVKLNQKTGPIPSDVIIS